MTWLAIAFGGALGAAARHALNILLRSGHTTAAFANAAGQVLAGLAATWAGFAVAAWRR